MKNVLTKVQLVVALTLAFQVSLAKPVLYKAVSPTFINGVQSKLLHHVAKELKMDIHITQAPLARRLQMLANGEIDLLVGLHKTKERKHKLIFIDPPYRFTEIGVFTLIHNKQSIRSFSDLETKAVGAILHSKYFPEFDKSKHIIKLEVSSVEQSIGLLLKGRIHAFVHNKTGGQKLINKLQLHEEITLAHYQPEVVIPLYFATSKNSPLYESYFYSLSEVVANISAERYQEITAW